MSTQTISDAITFLGEYRELVSQLESIKQRWRNGRLDLLSGTPDKTYHYAAIKKGVEAAKHDLHSIELALASVVGALRAVELRMESERDE